VFNFSLIQNWWIERQQVETIPYSQFRSLVDAGRVKDVSVGVKQVTGTLREPLPGGSQRFATRRVDEPLAGWLEQHGATVTGAVENTFLETVLSWLLPTLFFFGLWTFVFRPIAERRGMGGLMSIGKSKARVYMEKEVGVRFDDVAGVDEAKAELKEIVAFLQSPANYGRLGARVPSNYSGPGHGMTAAGGAAMTSWMAWRADFPLSLPVAMTEAAAA
jgi:cell division protease FtsH